MKPTREEILSASYLIQGSITDIERFALAMYRRGAEDIRERAATWWVVRDSKIADGIRDLPIGDE